MSINVGLYGRNGHQVHHQLVNHPGARLTAISAIDRSALPEPLKADASIRSYDTFAQLLSDPAIELVVMCSPRRSEQAKEAIAALEAGKHVLAEKPATTSISSLNEVLAASRRTGRRFYEMGGTAFEQPARAIRDLVLGGVLGDVVQVIARKSYPYHENRPQDEAIDGGITLQCAIHAVRMIEHAVGTRVTHVSAIETRTGNPVADGGLVMASCISMRLANGAVATASSNYLNPLGAGVWGNDGLQVFGTLGMAEFQLIDKTARLYLGREPVRAIDTSKQGRSYFDQLIDSLSSGCPMPLSLEDELHPTRVVLCAKRSVELGGIFVEVDAAK